MANEGTRSVKLSADINDDPSKLAALEAKLAGEFNATFADEDNDIDDPSYEPEEVAEDEPVTEEVLADEGPAAEADTEGPTEEAAEEAAAAAEESEVQIPDNLIRSAMHTGWTMDTIREMYAANPKLTLTTLEKMYEDNNNLTSVFAEIGRKNKAVANAPAAPAPPAAATTPKRLELKLPTAEQLKRDYPNDSLVDDLVVPMRTQMEQMAEVINELSARDSVGKTEVAVAVHEANTSADDRATQAEINAFFENNTMEQFVPIYGKRTMGQSWQALTPDQNSNRVKVCNLAEDIFLGAQAYGRPVTIEQALLKAHLVNTDEYRSQIVREDLLATAKKRSNSIQLKPSQGKRTVTKGSGTGKPGTQSELESKVRNKMRKVLGTNSGD